MMTPKYTINYTGATMLSYPKNEYGDYCSGNKSAYTVQNKDGKTVFVGTYQACINYINAI